MRITKVTTRNGDGGKTNLAKGESVLKSDNIIHCLGEIDELTPVAMMATLDVEFYEEKYGDSNIDFLIVKPFELAQLRNLVEEAMRLCQRLKGTV